VAIVAAISTSSARASIIDTLTTPEKAAFGKISDLTVGSVMDTITQKADKLGQSLATQYTLATGNTFITLQAEIQGVQEALDSERTKLVSDVNDQRLLALLDLYNLSDQVGNGIIPADIDQFQVDTLNVLNHLNFIGRRTAFMVSLITPTTVVYQTNGDYTSNINGIGLGSKEGVDYQTTVTIFDPHSANISAQVKNTTLGISITIPRSQLDAYFAENAITKLNVKVTSQVPGSWSILNWFPSKKTYVFPYEMVIFPKNAIHLSVQQSKSISGLDGHDVSVRIVHATTGDWDGETSPHPWVASPDPIFPDGGYLITKVVQLSCTKHHPASGNPCAFVYLDGNVNNPLAWNQGKFVSVKGSNNSWAVDMDFQIYEQKQITTAQALPLVSLNFSPGESKWLDVEQDADTVSLTMTPVIGSQQVSQLLPPGGSGSDLIVCTSPSTPGGNVARYLCKAKGYDAF
jgi:hypothetical protein